MDPDQTAPDQTAPDQTGPDPVELYCAVDIMGGAAVRLTQGDFDRRTDHGDPVDLALRYVQQGARFLHVVDLDAALGGQPVNRRAVLRIVEQVGVPVQVGGGVRGHDEAAFLLDSGVARVVVSTTAVEHPELVDELASLYPGRIVLGLDHRSKEREPDHRSKEREPDHRSKDREPDHRSKELPSLAGEMVAVRGWKLASAVTVEQFLDRFAAAPIGAVVVTSIARDGMLGGPDMPVLESVLALTAHPVVASGGVRSAGDLAELAAMSVLAASGEIRRVAGAVVGRALVNGSLQVREALAACER